MRWSRTSIVLSLCFSLCWGCALLDRHTASIVEDPSRLSTVRIALTHWQEAGSEHFEIGRLVDEGPWTGASQENWTTDEFGLYRCEIVDASSALPIFVQGYCTVFGEWLTTDLTKSHPDQRFAESLRVPGFQRNVRLRIQKRNRENIYATIFESAIDLRSALPPSSSPADVTDLGVCGDPKQRLDIAFLAEGYSQLERAKFIGDASRLAESLFQLEPYAAHRNELNLRAVFVASSVSGVSKPDKEIERPSALGCRYSTFGLPRYVLTLEDERVRALAGQTTYDAIVILLNDSEYGGGGVFEQYCVVAADSPLAAYLLVHEFGHSLSGLGDEYYTSQVAYKEFVAQNVEPWEPNATALLDPSNPKWKPFLSAGTTLPTEWGKTGYEDLQKDFLSKQDELRRSGLNEVDSQSEAERWRAARLEELLSPRGVVGAFEGALYASKGLYRPEVDCIMFRREATRYCSVCASTIADRLRRFVANGSN